MNFPNKQKKIFTFALSMATLLFTIGYTKSYYENKGKHEAEVKHSCNITITQHELLNGANYNYNYNLCFNDNTVSKIKLHTAAHKYYMKSNASNYIVNNGNFCVMTNLPYVYKELLDSYWEICLYYD